MFKLCSAFLLSFAIFAASEAQAGDTTGSAAPAIATQDNSGIIRVGYPGPGRSAMIALGERLFFDTRLSGSGRTACATCHDPRYG